MPHKEKGRRIDKDRTKANNEGARSGSMETIGELVSALSGLKEATFFGILIFVGWLLYTGKLLPASSVKFLQEERDNTVEFLQEERDTWKNLAMKQQEINRENADTIKLIGDGLKTSEKLISALPNPAKEEAQNEEKQT